MWKPPHACRPCHAHPSTPHRARGSSEAQRAKSFTVVKTPHLPAHRFGPGPTTCRAYVWPRPGGSCRCTKVGALLLTPLLVHGQSEPCAAATPSRAGEGSRREAKGTRRSEATPRPETQDSKGARWTPPARPLPGRPPRPQQGACRGKLPDAGRASHP